jgi:hypothetical protein
MWFLSTHQQHGSATLQVEVTDPVTNQTFYFVCNDWLDAKTGLERVLKPLTVDPAAARTPYRITTVTSNQRNAGTDANVRCTAPVQAAWFAIGACIQKQHLCALLHVMGGFGMQVATGQVGNLSDLFCGVCSANHGSCSMAMPACKPQ